jgi:hypothetical protein
MRVRLKADGRLVEVLADGSEAPMPPVPPEADHRILAPPIQPGRPPEVDADYARRIRAQVRLTQTEFAAARPRARAAQAARPGAGRGVLGARPQRRLTPHRLAPPEPCVILAGLGPGA